MLIRAVLSASIYAWFVDAVPTVTFPINSQVPPVARVNEPFSFTFSQSTFTSTLPLTYTLSNAPSWLSLNGASRTLSGTPSADSANSAPIIEVTATDSSGAVTMNTTLVVSGNPAPSVSIPLELQLPKFGAYSAPNSILYYPSETFTIKFDPATFSSPNLNHYAVTLDNTPLPSWIQFDGSALTFTGRTPNSASLVLPPQNFGIQLIASDVLGFAGVSLPFYVVVANHELAFTDAFIEANGTAGSQIRTPALRDTLKLDGVTAAAANISSITAQTPSWLTLDTSTLQLTGTAPASANTTNVTITATDIYGGTTSAKVSIHFANTNATLFSGALPSTLRATIGSPFFYNLSSAFADPSDVAVVVSETPALSWLSFNSSTFNLSGDVPSTQALGTEQVTLRATSRSSQVSGTQSFALNFVSRVAEPTTTTSPTASNDPSATSSAVLVPASSGGRGLTKGQLAAAIAVPILVLLLALILCLFCCCRKRRRYAESRAKTPEKSSISNPVVYYTEPRLADEHLHPALRNGQEYYEGDFNAAFANPNRRSALVRRSQTLSTMLSGRLSAHLRDGLEPRVRSFSETAASNADDSWRSTQSDLYPTMGSLTIPPRSRPITRNFSRKTMSGQLSGSLSGGNVLKDSTNSLNVGYGKYTVSKSSIQRTPDMAYDGENVILYRQLKKNQDFLSTSTMSRRLSGLGHGLRQSGSNSSISSERRYSRGIGIGHGFGGRPKSFGPEGHSMVRESNSWMTVQTGLTTRGRPQSQMSAVTESTDVLNYPMDAQRKSIKIVPKSPAVTTASSRWSNGSKGNKYARPVSRRDPRASPFFGGGSSSRSTSRGTTQGMDARFRKQDDAPGLPQPEDTHESLEKSIMAGLRDVSETPAPRDSLGISYGSAKDATGHLRTFVKSVTQRLSWRNNGGGKSGEVSPSFADDDSRFRSAEHSPGMLTIREPPQAYGSGHKHGRILSGSSAAYTDIGEDDDFFNRDSFASLRDSKGNIIQYDIDESPELGQAVARPSLSKPFSSYGSSSPNPQLVISKVREKYHLGPERRPVSVERERSLRKETSFTATHFASVPEGSPLSRRTGSPKSVRVRNSLELDDTSFDQGPAFL